MDDQWDPFGPTDDATPDIRRILARAQKTRLSLHGAQVKLTGMRHGPGPDNTPPVVQEVSRTDGLWPYLLIRSYAGDTGTRPVDIDSLIDTDYWGSVYSPDIIMTPAGPPGEPSVVWREGIAELKSREQSIFSPEQVYDLWVHVWNLGRFQAAGVRIRARLLPVTGAFEALDWLNPPGRYLGGVQLDLGDRLSETAHLAAKVATFAADDPYLYWEAVLIATAETITDVATGDLSPGADRHTAHRVISYIL